MSAPERRSEPSEGAAEPSPTPGPSPRPSRSDRSPPSPSQTDRLPPPSRPQLADDDPSRAGGPSIGRRLVAEEKRSFGFALAGLAHAWRTQRHLRIHVGVGLLAIVCGAALGMSPAEWAVLLLTIASVLVLELVNTVIEAVVDLASPAYHPLAKVAKDVAAGAVLVAAIGSVAVGAVLFLPRLWRLLAG